MDRRKRFRILATWLLVFAMVFSFSQTPFALEGSDFTDEQSTIEETTPPPDDTEVVSEEPSGPETDGTETPPAEGQTDDQEEQDPADNEESQETAPLEDPDGTLAEDGESPVEETETEEAPAVMPLIKAPSVRAAAAFDPNSRDTSGVIDMEAKGIKVNFFDYGPTSIDRGWASTNSDKNNTGINSGKTLKFFQNGLNHGDSTAFPQSQDYNNWTGSPSWSNKTGAAANQGIVQNTLDNGYPKLAVGNKDNLAYLFDPDSTDANTAYRTDYLNVNGLLKKVSGSSSEYEVGYNCLDNYAYLDSDGKTFILNDGTYYCDGKEASGPIGFFPFNTPDASKTDVSGERAGYYNHHFGMTMDAYFTLTESGQLGGEDMTFEFSGDDDMWVFVDGVLVLDIGGIHQPVAGTINFKDGTVSMQDAPIYDGQNSGAKIMSATQNVKNGERKQASDGKGSYYYDQSGNLTYVSGNNMTLSHIFQMAGRTWNDEPYSTHRIQVFYLERGGMYSNLDISMNLLTTKDVEVQKEIIDDEDGEVTDLDGYFADDEDTYDYKIHIAKEDSEEYFVYNGQNGSAGSGVYDFGGYEVYDNGVLMTENVPTFSEDGVISLTRTQKVRIKSIPFDRKYYVEEVNIDSDKFSDTKSGTKVLTKEDAENGYSVSTDEVTPEDIEVITFSNVAIEKKEPHKTETAPYQGNDEVIPDPDDASKTITNEAGELGGVRPGDEITYEISWANTHKEKQDVTITDKLDDNVEFVSAEGATYDSATHTVTWNFEANGNTEDKVSLTVKVKDSAVTAGKVKNEKATVKVGNYTEDTESVTNPVADPHKNETAPYEGNDETIPDPNDATKRVANEAGELGVVKPGDTITYEISYKNYKNTAADIVITDTLDSNVQVEGTPSDGGVVSGSKVTWTLPAVPAGTEGTVTVTVKVKDGAVAAGQVQNKASVKVGDDPVMDTETVTDPVPDEPEKKEVVPYTGTGTLGAVKPEDSVTYKIDYTNYRSKQTNVVIRDVLDENVEYASSVPAGVYDEDTHTVVWIIPTEAKTSGSVSLTVTVKDSARTAGKISNEAFVKVGNDSEVKTDEVENPVPDAPVKEETAPYEGTGLLGGVKAGEEITYKISYKNYKQEAARVTITDPLDENVTFVSADPSATVTDGVVTWTINDVPAGQEGFVTLTVRVNDGVSGEVIDNQANVAVGNDYGIDTEVVSNPTGDKPVKTETTPGEGKGVKPGDEVTYQISYKNYKTEAANVTIEDTLDPNVTFKSASDHGQEADGVVNWTIENVAAGDSGTVTLTVTVNEDAKTAGKIGNEAYVKVGNDNKFKTDLIENPVPENPAKEETAPDQGVGELKAVKPGDSITYKISYKNYKSQAANVTIRDTLDENVTFDSASDEGQETDGVVNWTIENVPAGQEGYVTLTVKVKDSAKGKVVANKAYVTVGNDQEFETEEVTNPVPDDPAKKETDPYEGTGTLGGVKPGEKITYEIDYKNYRSTEADVVITDELDENVVFISASGDGSEEDGVITWTIEKVPAGRSGHVTLTVQVKETGVTGKTVKNDALVKVGNDSAFRTNEVENPVPEDPEKKETDPYLGIGEQGPVEPGRDITYTIHYKNYKTSAADVTIRDTLDENVTFVSADPTATVADGVVTWTVEGVSAGAEGDVTLVVKVKDGAKGKIVANKAYVTVGNDNEFETNEVTNPVPDEPEKTETDPYTGTGELGAVKPGQDITYTISYKNYKSDAANVVITDTLDKNVTFKSASNDGAENDGVVTWTIPNVKAGGEGTVTLTVTVKADAKGKTVANTAVVKVGNDKEYTTDEVTNPVPEDPEKEETAPYTGTGELGGVQAGEDITYTVSYKNYKSTKANVVITDTLDENVTFKEASDNGAEEDGVVTWTIPNVEAGAEGTVTLTVTVKNDAKGKIVANKAVVKVGNDNEFETNEVTNPVPESPQKTETAPFEGTGELGAVKPGQDITYTISYKNYKSAKADVVIKDTLDENVSFKSASDSGAEEDGVVTWTIPNVEAGAEGTVTLTVTVKDDAKGKTVANKAVVKVGNDAEFETNEVTNPVPEDPEKEETAPYTGTGELGGVKPGEDITYTISYKNYKSVPANVVVKDTLDKNVTFKSASDSGAAKDGVVTWTIENVPAGQEGTVTLTVTVKEDAKGKTVANKATVSVNNEAEFETNEVTNPVPEDPVKTEAKPYEGEGLLGGVKPGEEISYTISYKNYKSTAADVVITDELDKNVDFVEASDAGAVEDGVVTWTIPSVAAGQEGTVTLTVTVKEDAKGVLVNNRAVVKVGNDHDFYTKTVTNPTTTDPVKAEPVPGPDVAVRPGDEVEYEVSYDNYHPVAADVIITDKLDENVTFVSADNGGVYDEETHTITWTIEKVPAHGEEGSVGKVGFTVEVKDSALESNEGPGQIHNGAIVKIGNGPEMETNVIDNPVPEDPVKTETDPYEGIGEQGAVKPGEEITYTISYKNYKASAADVVITDTLDKNVEFVEASDDGAEEEGVVTWTIPEVAAGEEGTVTLTVKVKKDAKGKTVLNSAVVQVGHDPEYYTDTVENPVPEDPVKKEVAPYEGAGEELGAVKPGEEITYEISYKNYKKTAADVVITDSLDENVEFVEASDDGELLNEVVTWEIKDVAPGTEGKVTLTVKVKDSAEGKIVANKAIVTVGNDASFETEEVTNPVPEDPVKEEIAPYEGTGLLGAVDPGQTIEYKITYRNYKSKTADVIVTDKLDKNVTFESASDNGKVKDGVVTWKIKDVPAGEEGSVTLTVKVKKDAKGELINNGATVQVGDDPGFNTEIVSNPTTDDPVKAEVKPGEGKTVKSGDTVTYEISYYNAEPRTAKVVVTDKLDSGVDFVSAKGGVYDKKTHTVTWTIKKAPAGEYGKVSLTVRVNDRAAKAEKIENGATVKVGDHPAVDTNVVKNPVKPPKKPPKTGDNGLPLMMGLIAADAAALMAVTRRRKKA